VPFLLPLLLQVGFGLNPFQSGLLTFLNTAGAMSMRAWVRHLVRRFGFRAVFVSGVFIISVLMAGFALFEPSTPHILIAAYLFQLRSVALGSDDRHERARLFRCHR